MRNRLMKQLGEVFRDHGHLGAITASDLGQHMGEMNAAGIVGDGQVAHVPRAVFLAV